MLYNVVFFADQEADRFAVMNTAAERCADRPRRFCARSREAIAQALDAFAPSSYYIYESYPPRPFAVKWHITRADVNPTQIDWFETDAERLEWVRGMARKYRAAFVVEEWIEQAAINVPAQPKTRGRYTPDNRSVLTRDYKSGKCDW